MLTFFAFILFYICTFALPSLVVGGRLSQKKVLRGYKLHRKLQMLTFFAFIPFYASAPPTPSLVGGWKALSLFVATLDFCAVQAICGGGAIMAKRYPGDLHWQALEIFATRLTLVLSKGIILGQNDHYRSYANSRKSPWQAEAIPLSSASIGTMGRSNERTVVLTTLMSMSMVMMTMMLMMIAYDERTEWTGDLTTLVSMAEILIKLII